MGKRIYSSLIQGLMGLLVFFLPFTSFPLMSHVMGSMVAPLSAAPLAIVIFAWFIPYLLRSGKLPPQSVPLFWFLAAVVFSSALAFFQPFFPFRSVSIVRRELEAFASLGVGIGFYLVFTVWARKEGRLTFLLRWINWGGLLQITWAVFQAVVWQKFRSYPEWMWNFQGMVSSSLLLYGDRVNGFAYEPSWLAHQLNMIYLPFWLSAVVNGYTAHKLKVWKFHFEHLLLALGFLTLLLSVSRIGLLTFIFMIGLLFLFWNIRLINWLPGIVMGKISQTAQQVQAAWRGKLIRLAVMTASIIVLVAVYIGLLAGAAYGLSRYDARMRTIFDFSTLKEKSFFHYANQLVFAERIVFWQAGWEVFNDYPILGTGLGNAGFLFPQKLSAFSWALTEIRMLMYQWTSLPNIKSLWVRLLAETGILGFSIFCSWLYVLWKSASFLRSGYSRAGMQLLRTVGLAGSFVLVGLFIEGFSIDTFALPYFWVSFGLLTAACEMGRQAVMNQMMARQTTGNLISDMNSQLPALDGKDE